IGTRSSWSGRRPTPATTAGDPGLSSRPTPPHYARDTSSRSCSPRKLAAQRFVPAGRRPNLLSPTRNRARRDRPMTTTPDFADTDLSKIDLTDLSYFED